ncbi:MAG: hypothetical protein AAB263_01515 [Planctomycetota bacterium]
MHRALWVCCFLCFLASAIAGEPQKILMVGNSLTYTYGIPAILENFAKATKRTLTVTTHVAGGRTLTWHWSNPSGKSEVTAPQAIAKGGYDLVIIQDSAQPLMKSGEGAEAFVKVVPDFVKAIRNASMQAMLYMGHPTAKEVKLESVQSVIDAYAKAADALAIPCAPSVLAFVRFNEKYPKIALLDGQADRKYALGKAGTHHSPFGAYLAACTLYATIYKQTPVGLTFHAAFDAKTEVPIDVADAAAAQEIAWQVVQEYERNYPLATSGKAPAH